MKTGLEKGEEEKKGEVCKIKKRGRRKKRGNLENY